MFDELALGRLFVGEVFAVFGGEEHFGNLFVGLGALVAEAGFGGDIADLVLIFVDVKSLLGWAEES